MMSAAARSGLAALMTALLGACAPSGPLLERFDESLSEWFPLGPVAVESMHGMRDGADVRATAVVSDGTDRVMLIIELHLDPPARFVSGRHQSVIDGASFEGEITADSVDFLGGQSTASSVGGIYRFEGPGGALYRVRIPVTELRGQ